MRKRDFDIVPTPEHSDPFKEIRDQVKTFEPSDLLYYVTLLGTLPGNEIKCTMLETLFKVIISTRKKKFKNSKLNKEDIERLLENLKTNYDWKLFEDFTPTQLFDYPAIWILGKRYNVFSGPEDRSYEFWKELISDYFPIRDAFQTKGYDPVEIIEDILTLETALVSLIRKHATELCEIDKLTFPSSELFKSWKHTINEWYQNSPNKTFYERHSVKLGRKINSQHLVEQTPYETLYKIFAISFEQCIVPNFQHNLFDFLNTIFLSDFKDLKKQNPSLSYDTSQRLYTSLVKILRSENNFTRLVYSLLYTSPSPRDS